MKQVLITGGNGQLGTELKRFAWPDDWQPMLIDIDELDLRDPDAIAAMVASNRWAAVINAGAYTAVDQAESNVVPAWEVNALAPAALASACQAADIPILHVSTDYVFDGARDGAWEPEDTPGPLSIYGASKLGGEIAVRTSATRHVIVRTAWVVSAHGNNFVKTMLKLATDRDLLNVVDDQRGAPTSAVDLAAALATITMRLVDDADAPVGTYHFSNSGATTWARFAREIFAQSAARGGPSATVSAIRTIDFPTAAVRPANSLLSHAAILRDYKIAPRPWQDALAEILDELIGTPQ
ncbi:dTDP-4-dehydrorhamnose reductase [Sphingomonas panacisoli]|uniref:dTDP-4-dehydrorhamnose reductase n=1 Tax=Sphingomonas panacisoli TaxID=1813879 RepID=A0A5B8LGC7_9SPHN|nr:dTDP-4-dehydrorhamnose reductase [Sphingomonas panacisoli]QDZ06936.1 dTDP-4-dehydrorhamnose reductase [Sphingomonas panacisoli]